MKGNVSARAKNAKNGQFRIRNQKRQIQNPISPVMQEVRGLLPKHKAPVELHILTDVPISTCQKMLTGQTPENLKAITGLLRSDHGREVLFALMGDARPAWFSKYRQQLDVIDANRALKEAEAKVAKINAEVFR